MFIKVLTTTHALHIHMHSYEKLPQFMFNTLRLLVHVCLS